MEHVVIGVDPHKLSATIEVVDHHEHLLGSGRFPTDRAGYAAMRSTRGMARAGLGCRGRQRRRPASGAAAPRRRRARHRRASQARARVRLFDTGHNRKTDAHDAHPVAVVAVRTTTLRVLQLDGELGALRMLADGRSADQASGPDRRSAPGVACWTPAGAGERDITTGQAKAMLGSVRPRHIAGRPDVASPRKSWPS